MFHFEKDCDEICSYKSSYDEKYLSQISDRYAKGFLQIRMGHGK